MGSPDDNKYYVIEAPYKGIDEYVCIPWTWLVSRSDDNVVVAYPVENPSVTEKRVKGREGISKEWKFYKSIVRCQTNSYYHAKHITSKMNEFHCKHNKCLDINTADHESSASVEKTTHTQQGANLNQNNDRSARKTTLKQTPQPNPETEAALKRSKVVEPAESVSKVTVQWGHAFECPNENSSLEPVTIADPELFTVLFTLLRDLHKSSTTNRSVIEIVRETLIMNDKVMKEQAKIIDELCASLASRGTTAEVEKISEINNKKTEEQDDGDNVHEVVNNKNRRRTFKFVLPPEYDENDSRWTLKHRELLPGLVELMPRTSVYIDAAKLSQCKRSAKDCRSLARLLSLEIFTINALIVCSLTGKRARAYDVKEASVRPGLDKNARIAILNFVEAYRQQKGWKSQENQANLIKKDIRNIMEQLRRKYGCHRCRFGLGC